MLSVLLLLCAQAVCIRAVAAQTPQLGAQIWIEPGQTPAQIDGWFEQLAASHMPVARIFVMWSQVETRPGQWDFSLYDEAFRAAGKSHVKIVATLTPSGPPTFRGGNGTQGRDVVGSLASRQEAAVYISEVVRRYRTNPALDSWLLLNEPGRSPTAQPLAISGFSTWLATQYLTVDALNKSWGKNFSSFSAVVPDIDGNSWNRNSTIDWTTYWRGYQTEQLAWLAAEVRKNDPTHPLHLNPHALVGNLASLSDDLPAWRVFLDSLGCSIHPAWHFGLLGRDRYTLGVSYVNDLIAGSIEPKPYWVTELQGGTNITSALRPLDPTPDEIAQWVWTSLGAGAERVIFWLLNARRAGVEAGEWSLLNFQQGPSARLQAAAQIASTVDAHPEFFERSHAVRPDITLVLSLETMTLEDAFARDDSPARGGNAHVLEALGFYRAISELGVPPQIKHFEDYPWAQHPGDPPRTVVLPDVRVLSPQQVELVQRFAQAGNTVIITGLSGVYDRHALSWPLAGFPLGKLTGADLKEILIPSVPNVQPIVGGPALPAELWLGTVQSGDATATASWGGETTATERKFPGGGRVVWVPSMIGIGDWKAGGSSLAVTLQGMLKSTFDAQLFRFTQPEGSCLLRVLQGDAGYVTVVANSGPDPVTCRLLVRSTAIQASHPEQLWGAAAMQDADTWILALPGGSTSVLGWRSTHQ